MSQKNSKVGRKTRVYHFAARPDPLSFPRHDVGPVGEFLIRMPGTATLDDLCELMTRELPFGAADDVWTGQDYQPYELDATLDSLTLAVGGEVVVMAGEVSYRLAVRAVRVVGPSGAAGPALDLADFDCELLGEMVEEEWAVGEDLEAVLDRPPVSRVIGSVAFARPATGQRRETNPSWRSADPVTLGFLALVATDDGPLDLADAVLTVATPGQPPSRLYSGRDFELWTRTSVADLGVPPGPVAVLPGDDLLGVLVEVHPDPARAEAHGVTGAAHFFVVSNGDFWRMRAHETNATSEN